MANTTSYSNEQIAHALGVLESYQGNAKRAAQELGIPRTTLRAWAGRATIKNGKPKQVQPDAELAEKFERVAHKALGFAETDAVLADAGLRDLMMGADIATRSARLLRGQSTSNNMTLQIQLVAGGSLQELADRVMSVQKPLELGAGQDKT